MTIENRTFLSMLRFSFSARSIIQARQRGTIKESFKKEPSLFFHTAVFFIFYVHALRRDNSSPPVIIKTISIV